MPAKPARKSAVTRAERPLRADAKLNRERLLSAAESVFSEIGADASLDDVARRAQVGIGTLYRHFPTRESLLAAACDDRLLTLAESSRARTEAAPRRALADFLEALVRHASIYRGLAASLGVVLQNGSPGCHAATEEGTRLLEVARRANEVRGDVDFDDVVCMATAISLMASQEPSSAARIPRLVSMFVEGLRAETAPAPAQRKKSSIASSTSGNASRRKRSPF